MLATLGFDLNIQHPYKPLVEAIKKFNVAKNALAQVAWNFVNDGYDKDLIFGVDKFPTLPHVPFLTLSQLESGVQATNFTLSAI